MEADKNKVFYDALFEMVERDIERSNKEINIYKWLIKLWFVVLVWNAITVLNAVFNGSYLGVINTILVLLCIYYIKYYKHTIKRVKYFIKKSRERRAEAEYIIEKSTPPEVN